MVRSVYMLRHAESVGNVEGYDVPDPDRLTDTGRDQAGRVANALADRSFDRIACSPLQRTRGTIRPYLRTRGAVAEVWGELQEACWQTHEDREVASLRYGPGIELSGDDEHFELNDREYPACHPPEGETYAEGLERIRLVESRVRDALGSDGCDSLLLVGHGHSHLPRLCELLLGVTPDGPRRFSLDNVGLTKLERETDPGAPFRVAYSNRIP